MIADLRTEVGDLKMGAGIPARRRWARGRAGRAANLGHEVNHNRPTPLVLMQVLILGGLDGEKGLSADFKGLVSTVCRQSAPPRVDSRGVRRGLGRHFL
jgi:hypothetical protein